MPGKYHKVCPVCNKDFIAFQKHQRRCSWSCMGKAYSTSIKKSCLKCGKEFLVQPHRIKQGRGKCCSKECWDNFKIVFFRKRHGYIHEYAPDHPHHNKMYVPQHRLIMERYIGRYLSTEEVVHHINQVCDDNRIENLMLFPNDSEHQKFHWNVLGDRRENISKRQRKEDGKFA